MNNPVLPANPSLGDLQHYIKDLCAARGWDKNSHLEIFLLFSEEIGELAKAIRNKTKLYQEAENQKDVQENLEEEFADVLSYLLDLANYFEVDLEKAFRQKNDLNAQRTWQ